MKVSQINNVDFGKAKLLDRRMLQKGDSALKNLNGPYEIKQAKKMCCIFHR